MKRVMVRIWVVAAILAIAGCGGLPSSNALMTSSEAIDAKGVVEILARGDIDGSLVLATA